jgi:hypothetical protein
MNERFLYPSARHDDGAAKRPLDGAIWTRDVAADLPDRACCCPAMAAVQVIMPPSPARPDETELLLCGHHYRVSRQILEAARARVRGLPGAPGDTAAWILPHGAPASVN